MPAFEAERAPDPPAHPTDPPERAIESLQWSAPPEAFKPESIRPSTRLPAGLASALAPPSRVIDDDNDSDAPSSLEDAVMREISERSPEPSPVLGGLDLPPIVEPSALRPRSSNPPANEETPREAVDEQALLPSIPPDAIVPAATSNEEFAVAAPVFGDVITSHGEEVFQLTSERRLVARDARDLGLMPGAAPEPGEDARRAATLERERENAEAGAERDGIVGRGDDAPALVMRETDGEPRAAIAAASPPIISLPPDDLHEVAEEPQGRAAPASEAPAPTSSPWGFVIAFALLAGAVVGGLRMTTRDVEPQHPAPGPSATAATVPSANPAPNPAMVAPANPANPSPAPSVAGAASSSGAVTTDDALPPDMAVPAGYGLLQIAAPRGAHVLIDGVDAGTGPLASSVQRAGYHQVRIDRDGKHSQFVIEVRAQKATRVKSSPLP